MILRTITQLSKSIRDWADKKFVCRYIMAVENTDGKTWVRMWDGTLGRFTSEFHDLFFDDVVDWLALRGVTQDSNFTIQFDDPKQINRARCFVCWDRDVAFEFKMVWL